MKETLKLALEALEAASRIMDATAQQRQDDAITAIKEALAQPAQEPVVTIAVREHAPVGKVAYVLEVNLPVGIHNLYTSPPQRPWIGLTDQEAQWLYDNCRTPSNLIDMVETMLKEKNT